MLTSVLARRAAVAAVAATAALGAAAPAMAASDHFFSGGLSAGRSYASASAHTGVYYASANANHTVCAGIDQGHSGYFYGAPVDFGPLSACGPGGTSYRPSFNTNNTYYHGAVFNPNQSTSSSVSDSHYSW